MAKPKKRQETANYGGLEITQQLPQDAAAERAVLGDLIAKPELYYEACLDLSLDDFVFDSHRRIYNAIIYLQEESIPLTTVSLVQELQKTGEIEAVGGLSYVVDLAGNALELASHTKHQVEVLRDIRKRRQVIFTCMNVAGEAMLPGAKAEAVINQMNEASIEMAADAGEHQALWLRDIVPATVSGWRERAKISSDKAAIGLTYGNAALDSATTGMWAGEVTLLGGHAKDAKTSEAISILIANLKENTPCYYASHEMDRDTVVGRMMSQETSVPFARTRDSRKMNGKDWDAVEAAMPWLSKMPLLIEDSASMRIEKLVALLRLAARRDGVKLGVVDFLQKVDAPGDKQNEKVNYASNALRVLAKEEKIHLVILSQLTNPGDRERSKIKPNWRMFRDSANLAQDAHICLAVWRPEENGAYTGKDEILVLLQRSGPGGLVINVEFDRQRLKFMPRGGQVEQDQAEMDYA
jgi:replicative DNA helicase